jgi:hypothetical protein
MGVHQSPLILVLTGARLAHGELCVAVLIGDSIGDGAKSRAARSFEVAVDQARSLGFVSWHQVTV